MPPSKKKKSILGIILKYVVPIVISVGLCWLLFHDFDYREMLRLIREECDIRWIIAGLLVTIMAHIFRALRWRIQLRALGIDPPLFFLIISIFGTYAVNLVFPRLGEIWRTGYIAQRQHAPFTTVFGSMVADRLADTITVLLLTLATFALASGTITAFLAENSETYRKIAQYFTSPFLWAGIALIIALFWWLIRCKTQNKYIIKIQNAVKELWQGFIVIISMPHKGLWLLYTLGIWGCFFAAMFIEFFAFGFTADIFFRHGIVAVLVTFVLSSISMGVPSNGGIGPWQWSIIFALGIYGLGSVPAGAFGNMILGCTTLMNIALGIFTFASIAIDRKKSPAKIR